MNTKEYVRGKDKVIAIFTKELSKEVNDYLSFETTQNSFDEKNNGSKITLEIKDLVIAKLSDDWDKKQPNANKLLADKTATLVIYYGNVEGFGGGAQQIQITDKGAFITWQVESADYLTSIATSLKQNDGISVKVDLDVDDDFFAIYGKLYNSAINKISITFD
jgi:pullulanase/glycogen debranching enzyme